MQTEYKTLSKKTRALLQKSEGFDVDFKMNVQGLDTGDLVAFANSENGGNVLLGVDEIETQNGQRGKICGCEISDQNKISIINKAESCSPPIEIMIFTENTSHTPIFRIEIPSSSQKPHCTQKGIYKIRGDGRNIPLLPSRLLQMFLAQEGDSFLKNFKTATKELSHDLAGLQTDLYNLSHQMSSIWGSAEEASGISQDVLFNLDELKNVITELSNYLNWDYEISNYKMEKGVNAILAYLKINDPANLTNEEIIEQLFKKRK